MPSDLSRKLSQKKLLDYEPPRAIDSKKSKTQLCRRDNFWPKKLYDVSWNNSSSSLGHEKPVMALSKKMRGRPGQKLDFVFRRYAMLRAAVKNYRALYNPLLKF